MKRLQKLLVLVVAISMVLALVPIVGAEGGKININTAVKEELIELDRIGPKHAERIIE